MRYIAVLFLILTVLLLSALAVSKTEKPKPKPATNKRVLVVINEDSPASVEIGEYYATRREIPSEFVCRIKCHSGEDINREQFDRIKADIRAYLEKHELKEQIDFIVLTKGIPIRVSGEGGTFSVDSMLTILWTDYIKERTSNPYFDSRKRFSFEDYGFYLVTRLDGYTVRDAKALVARSLAAKPVKGKFVFDLDPSRDSRDGYSWVNDSQRAAIKSLSARGFECISGSDVFPGPERGVIGYYTWGSNHAKFDQKKYASNTYQFGAIAETVVSTSGRTFNPTTGGQSLIADLIKGGITGVKGYVAEPYTISIAQAAILFDRYTTGYNLAESFYAASPFLHWMDVVVGDPLCAPYGKKAASSE